MCAIVDQNAWGEVFGKQVPAGAFFYQWLITDGRLIFGGTRMRDQVGMDPEDMTAPSEGIAESPNKMRFRELIRSGHVERVPTREVDDKEQELLAQGGWRSGETDCHILALTLLRRQEVRLLYTNDVRLQDDFMEIADNADIYSARSGSRPGSRKIRPKHKRMLKKDLCAWP